MSRLNVGSIVKCKSCSDMIVQTWNLKNDGYIAQPRPGHIKTDHELVIIEDIDSDISF